MTSNAQIKIGAVMSYFAIGINILSGLLYTPWMIRCIGQSDYGLYTLATSLISLFMVDFGIGAAVSRFISKYLSEGREKEVGRLLGVVYKLYILIDIIILFALLIMYFFIDSVYANLTVDELLRFKRIYIIVGAYNVISFPLLPLNGILTSYEKFFQLKLCNILNKILVVVFMIAALWRGFGLYTLVVVNTFVGLLILFIKLIIVKRDTGIEVDFGYRNKRLLKHIFGFSVWVALITIFQRLIFNVMPTVLAAVLDSVSVAMFGLASTIEGYVYTFADAINGLFLSKVSRIVNGENTDEKLLALMIKVGRINFIIVGLIIGGFICAGKEFVVLWLGNDYINVYHCTVFMLLPEVFYFPQQIARTAVIAQNKVKYEAYIMILIGLLNILISFVTCKFIGVIGAGISICIAYTVQLILMNVLFKKVMKIDIKKFFYECYLKMSFPVLAALLFGKLLFYFVPFSGWMMFVLKCFLFTVVYISLMWIISCNSFERDILKGAASKLLKKI